MASIVPPASEISFVPTVAVKAAPAQEVLAAEAIWKPPGAPPIVVRSSLKDVMVAADDEGLRRVMVRVLLGPTAAEVGKKAFSTVGSATVREPDLAAALLPRLVTSPPTAMVLVLVPAVRPLEASWTGTVTVQVPGAAARVAAGMAPVDMLIAVAPGAATTVPPQLVLAAGEAATLKPGPMVESRLSVNDEIAAFEPNWLLKVIVRVEAPPGACVAGEKVLLETLTAGAVVVSAALTAG